MTELPRNSAPPFNGRANWGGDIFKLGHLPEREPFHCVELVIHRCNDRRPVSKLDVYYPSYGQILKSLAILDSGDARPPF
jgi:hypothetical protein